MAWKSNKTPWEGRRLMEKITAPWLRPLVATERKTKFQNLELAPLCFSAEEAKENLFVAQHRWIEIFHNLCLIPKYYFLRLCCGNPSSETDRPHRGAMADRSLGDGTTGFAWGPYTGTGRWSICEPDGECSPCLSCCALIQSRLWGLSADLCVYFVSCVNPPLAAMPQSDSITSYFPKSVD